MGKEPKEKIVVFYDNDADGFSGAWAAWKKFGRKAKYIPILVRGGESPCPLKNKRVYFIDGMFSEVAMKKIMKDNFVVVLDHHESVWHITKQADNYGYDKNLSGCVLAWQHFFPRVRTPLLLRYVQDMDLWRWELPKAREVAAVLDSYTHNLRQWSQLVKRIEGADTRRELFKEGKAIVRYEDRIIHQLVETHAVLIEFEGKHVFALNTPFFHSFAANQLATKRPPFAVIWYRKRDYWKISLRSKGSFNVANIAEKYGGGGHKNAAGFRIAGTKPLPWKFIREN